MLRSEFYSRLKESSDGLKYLSIVDNARKNPPDEKGELHHIYPRSFEEGKIDTEDNLVRLSVRDHLLCHYYLAKCFMVPETCHAFRMMWDLHTNIVQEDRLFESLDCVAELRKRGRLKTQSTIEKQRQQALGKIQINKDGKERKIRPKDLEKFTLEGWTKGRAIKVYNPSSGHIWVHKEKEEIYIKPEDLEKFMSEGWSRGRAGSSTKGKIRMSKGSKIVYAKDLGDVERLLSEGYSRGIEVCRKGIVKDGKKKYVTLDQLENYLNQGWKLIAKGAKKQ